MQKKSAPAKFRKSSPETVAWIDGIMAGVPCDRKKMFGYPCFFVNGNMFTGLFADDLFFRVDPAKKESLLKDHPEYREFEPLPGRFMREYLVISSPAGQDKAAMKKVVEASLKYASSLPKKKGK